MVVSNKYMLFNYEHLLRFYHDLVTCKYVWKI
jgi:hypothetical protein